MRAAPKICCIGLAIAVLAPAEAANASTSASGNACQGAFGATSIFHDDMASANDSLSSSALFMCPISLGLGTADSYTFATAWLYYIDNSGTAEFDCYLTKATSNGSQYWSAPKWTYSIPGGAVNSTVSFVGANYLAWGGQNEISFMSPISHQDSFSFVCGVPPATSHSNGGRSFVVSYLLY